jgi:hypothetical protein
LNTFQRPSLQLGVQVQKPAWLYIVDAYPYIEIGEFVQKIREIDTQIHAIASAVISEQHDAAKPILSGLIQIPNNPVQWFARYMAFCLFNGAITAIIYTSLTDLEVIGIEYSVIPVNESIIQFTS